MKVTTITLDTYKQKVGGGDAFNLTDSFNGRVGDEQVPLTVFFKERGLVPQINGEVVPFITGFVGELDENGVVTADTGEAVSYTGSTDDVVGLGHVKMNLPGTMFPQEGYFYGFLGLETLDHSQRVSTFSVWFHVYNGNPDMFVNKEPFRTELQKILDDAEQLLTKQGSKFNDAFTDWGQQVAKLLTNLNGDYAQIQTTTNAIKSSLSALEDKIKEDGLLTVGEASDLIKSILDSTGVTAALANFDQFSTSLGQMTIDDVDGGIPDYMDVTLSTAQNALDTSKFNLVFGTDHHYDIATTYNPFGGDSIANIGDLWESGLRKVLNMTSLTNADAIVFGGDNVDEPAVDDVSLEKKMMMKELGDFLDTAATSAENPVFLLKGNHDPNYDQTSGNLTLTNVITDKEFAETYQKNVGSYGESRSNGGNYFYKDFPDKKIRLIGLDSYDLPETVTSDGKLVYDRFTTSGFQQNQISWLATDALNVPAGYTVIITMHHPVDGTIYSDSKVINHDVVKQILTDFENGAGAKTLTGTTSGVPVSVTYNFPSAGKIAAVLSGHRHMDSNVTVGGVNYVETRCSLTSGDNMIKKTRWGYYGTALEDAFDIVTINTDTRTISFKRIGAGSEDNAVALRKLNY